MTGVMIQTAILVAAILAVQKVFGKKLHVYVRYGLWLLVALRLLLPVNLIDSPVSVLRIVETASARYEETTQTTPKIQDSGVNQSGNNMQTNKVDQSGNNMQIDKVDQADNNIQTSKADQSGNNIQTNEADQSGKNIQINETVRTASNKRLDIIEHLRYIPYIKTIMQAVWLMGSLIIGSFFGILHLCFRRRLRRTRTIYLGNISDAVQKKRVPIYRVKGLESPCLVGFFHPCIYIGADIDTDSDSFRYAVTHEEVHYLHRDHIWALVRVALIIVYWFHPFVWIAAAASARDGEIACDYGTVQRIGQEERFAYGEMLLTFSQTKGGKRAYSYGTMLRPGGSELRERILCLTETKSSRMWAGILTVVFMAVLAGCAFTGAAGDSENLEKDGSFNIVLKNPAGEESANTDDGLLQDEKNSQDIENNQNAEHINRENNEDIENYKKENQNESITQPLLLEAVPADISGETPFGADGPTLDYAGNLETGNESIIIFHDYFGLIVYDLMDQKIIRSLDLATIGCHMTQGDDACQVAVSADGTIVWLHPMSKPYKYRYDVEKDLLYQEPLVKTFSIDLEGEDLFDRYLVTETTQKYEGESWHSNYLYEEYKDEQGTHSTYIYLYLYGEEEQKLGSLQCVWDDMVFILQWDKEDIREDQSIESEDFPYRYDGVVNEVEIIYDKPCNYSRIADTFDSRIHPFTQEVKMHEGIDYAAEEGTDVVAAADGVVYKTGFSKQYGNYVVLLHINGEMTYYCQCQKIIVEIDDQVKRGEKIATVGSTGMSTGSHLHFALSRRGEFIDPEEHMRVVMNLE